MDTQEIPIEHKAQAMVDWTTRATVCLVRMDALLLRTPAAGLQVDTEVRGVLEEVSELIDEEIRFRDNLHNILQPE